MSRSENARRGSFRRYAGHKEHLAGFAARKAVPLEDRGILSDAQPFWAEPYCMCCVATCPDCGEEIRFWDDRMEQEKLRTEIALWQPEPPSTVTGRYTHVEWESDLGSRYWTKVDDGQLDLAIWEHRRIGFGLSDMCPVEMAA